MDASGVIDETGTGGTDPAKSSVPSDRAEGGVSGERLVLFTDAVTAISITLLILPLVDLVPEVAAAHEGASEVITGHLTQIWSFLLSFAVIANIWREHHRAFSSVTMVTRSLTVWNMGWLLSVVVLPLPTEMIGAFGGHDRFVGAFYYLTLLASMVCRLAMLRILKTTPGLVEEDGEGGRRRIEDMYTESYLNVFAVVIALVIALAVPVLQYYSLLLLAVLPAMARLRGRRTAR
ncbi:TMEM175 family protein [Streptomyces sp. NPDC102384]|uniref:TMEM175 family protein n=1 Tax=Streptomyces sp. NPDC102384 TaxID=3366166 RepID=UPI00381B9A3E